MKYFVIIAYLKCCLALELRWAVQAGFTIRYDTIEEINVDSKAEYTA